MTSDRHSIRNLLTAACCGAALLASAAVLSAVPVEESRASSSRDAAAAPRLPWQQWRNEADGGAIDTRRMSGSDASSADSGRLSQLFYQLQVLQQEVQELRGLVEEQQYRLDRLARDQQEQYLDLDRRMQALRGDGQRPLVIPGEGDRGPGGRGASSGPDSSSGGASQGGSASEREAYSAAFELMRQRRFEESAVAFEALTEEYPNGVYTANAFYWLGELNLALDDNEQARQWFAQVVNLYPDHQKIPDALYKLGVTYHRLGDEARAREYLIRSATTIRSRRPPVWRRPTWLNCNPRAGHARRRGPS
ncbi:MAG: tol-pal system protein YbgF [Gammaproteobacteria bacterium]|nr:tol-pal system protein YbgF [Gammaproteobacteria bacterium]